jgi:hypothetical protein
VNKDFVLFLHHTVHFGDGGLGGLQKILSNSTFLFLQSLMVSIGGGVGRFVLGMLQMLVFSLIISVLHSIPLCCTVCQVTVTVNTCGSEIKWLKM